MGNFIQNVDSTTVICKRVDGITVISNLVRPTPHGTSPLNNKLSQQWPSDNQEKKCTIKFENCIISIQPYLQFPLKLEKSICIKMQSYNSSCPCADNNDASYKYRIIKSNYYLVPINSLTLNQKFNFVEEYCLYYLHHSQKCKIFALTK